MRTTLAGGKWLELLRRPPIGVLVIAGGLGVLGAGLVLGALYVALTRADVRLAALAAGAIAGPLAIYSALHLLRLSHWAWLAMIFVFILLFLSSLWRLVLAPPPATAPIGEMVCEAIAMFYLTRPSIRAAFTRR